MRRFALVASVLALAACGEAPPAADDAPDIAAEGALPGPTANTILPPAANSAVEPTTNTVEPALGDAAAAYREPLRLIGTEPFWGVEISDRIVLQRPDHPTITTANTGPTVNGDVAVWTSREVSIRLEPGTCSDGMSDNRYPYNATVTLAGGEVLKGCGARADQWPREGG